MQIHTISKFDRAKAHAAVGVGLGVPSGTSPYIPALMGLGFTGFSYKKPNFSDNLLVIHRAIADHVNCKFKNMNSIYDITLPKTKQAVYTPNFVR